MAKYIILTGTLLLGLCGSTFLHVSGQDVPIVQGPSAQEPVTNSSAPDGESNVSCKAFVEQCADCKDNAQICAYHAACQNPEYAESDLWCYSLQVFENLPQYCESCRMIETGCQNVTEECPDMSEGPKSGNGIYQNIFPFPSIKPKCTAEKESCKYRGECCPPASCEDPNASANDPIGTPVNKKCIVYVEEQRPSINQTTGQGQNLNDGQGNNVGQGSNNGANNGGGGGNNGGGTNAGSNNGYKPFFPIRPTCNNEQCFAGDEVCCNGRFCNTGRKNKLGNYQCENCRLGLGKPCKTVAKGANECCGGGVVPTACAIKSGAKEGTCRECPRYNREVKDAPCEADSNCCQSDPTQPGIKYECRMANPDAQTKTCTKCLKEGEICREGATPCCLYPVGSACIKDQMTGLAYCQPSREENNQSQNVTVNQGK